MSDPRADECLGRGASQRDAAAAAGEGGSSAGRSDGSSGSPDRREFLAWASVATASLLPLAGCGETTDSDASETDKYPERDTATPPTEGSPEPTSTTVPSPFDSVTDLTEVGADPSGTEPIDAIVEEHAADGRLLHLPAGEYRLDDGIGLSGLERFGIAGDGATIVPTADQISTVLYLNADGPVHVENVAFDLRASDADPRVVNVRGPDDVVLRDLTVRGTLGGGNGAIRIDVTDPDGSGRIERLRLPDGSVAGERVTGCYVGDTNEGEILFKDCHIEGFSDNGLYADPTTGRMTVEGGYFANNGIANVRVKAGSVVRNVHVRCDSAARDFENMRGIWLTNHEPDADAEPPLVENCRVEMQEATYSDGAIGLTSELPGMRLRNTEIRVDVDNAHGVWAEVPYEEVGNGTGLECTGVSITGDAESGFGIKIDGRDGCVLEDIEVTHSSADRNGIGFQRSQGNVLRNARLNVGGVPILLQDATLDTFDINVAPAAIESETAEETDQ